jgi:hypothetical protein
MHLSAGDLLARYCSDSFQPFDLGEACPGSVARASKSCPWVVLAVGAPLHLAPEPLDATIEALVVLAAAEGYPISHSPRPPVGGACACCRPDEDANWV